YVMLRQNHPPIEGCHFPGFSPFSTDRRETNAVWNVGGDFMPVVISDRSKIDDMSINPHFIPDYIYTGNRLPANFPKGMKSIVDFAHWENKIDHFPLFTLAEINNIQDCQAEVKFLRLSYPQLTDILITRLKEMQKVVVILTTDHQNGVG